MKTKAVRIYGKNDLRLEEFDLPARGEDEILARVVSDSICMSSHKAAEQGAEHKRVPDDVAEHPTIIGHEFCGEILEVGSKWRHRFQPGDKFSIQPALNYKGSLDAPGYSFRYIGGDATRVLIPNEVMEMGCLLKYTGPGYFPASLSEPMSCIIGAFHASYHMNPGSYTHHMGIREQGNMAILGGVGPMGLGAIDYALHGPRRPKHLVVTDIDDTRIKWGRAIFTVEEAARCGVKLEYVNTAAVADPAAHLRSLIGGDGYDDVFTFAPIRPVVETADRILGRDGCHNFFAGPINPEFRAEMNFYNVHYAGTHVAGTSGGTTEDMKEALALMSQGGVDPSPMVTHIGGLNAVAETTLNLPKIPGGKKLIYTNIRLDLTAIVDFEKRGTTDPVFKELAKLTGRNNCLWSLEAEEYLLAHAKPLE